MQQTFPTQGQPRTLKISFTQVACKNALYISWVHLCMRHALLFVNWLVGISPGKEEVDKDILAAQPELWQECVMMRMPYLLQESTFQHLFPDYESSFERSHPSSQIIVAIQSVVLSLILIVACKTSMSSSSA